jgi:HEAT repeat protein
MKCEEVNFILDAHAPDALTLRQKQAVDQHFAACCECRAAWAAYRELAAVAIPTTPLTLRPRVAAALAACAPPGARAVRRSLAIAGALLVGAAAAATIAIQLSDRAPSRAEPIEDPASAAAPLPAAEPGAAPVSAAQVDDGVRADSPNVRVVSAPTAAPYAVDPYSVVVVLVPNPAVDAQAAEWLAQCHAEVVQQLTAVDGLNVIAGERLSPYTGSDLPAEEIARQLGAASVLVVSTMDQAMLNQIAATRAELGLDPRAASCRAQHVDAQTGTERSPVVAFADPAWRPDRPRAFAVEVAERVRETTLEDRATVIAAAQATVLDTALGDRERVAALAELRQGREFTEPNSPSGPEGVTFRSPVPLIHLRASVEPIPEAFDDAVVAAVAQIGMTSTDARARQIAWGGLRGVRHPYAVQALLYSLANDADENVRRAAALALGYLVDEPGVRDALTRAAAQDPSEDPPIPCCIPSVRDAARRALLSDEELHESTLRTVLDETLPSDERLRPLHQSIDGRGFPVQLSDEAARAVFDIGRGAEDAILRSRAWDSLSGFRNPDFTRILLDDLTGHPAENVRASAAAALRPYVVDDPVVRSALEQAQTDSSMGVRRAARSALNGGGR